MRVLWILGLIFGLNFFINAQTAVLSGTVRQADNHTIPKVKITAYRANNEKFETISDMEGFYTLNLPQDKYVLEFYAAGYKRAKFENYLVGGEGSLRLDVTLEVGMITTAPIPDPSTFRLLCGKVIDKLKEAIPNALIEAKRIRASKKSDNKIYKSLSDEKGNYLIELPDGLYNITFKSKGFKKFVLKNQLLPIDPRGCKDIELEVDAKD